MVEDFLNLAGLHTEGSAASLRAGALAAHRAGAARLLVELDDDDLGTAQGAGHHQTMVHYVSPRTDSPRQHDQQ